MKRQLIFLLLVIVYSCQPNSKANDELVDTSAMEAAETILLPSKPSVSFTFDDGITRDLAGYKFKDWNNRILTSLSKEGVTAAFFVTGSNKLDTKGQYLLESWSNGGHLIANHTYSHPNFNNAHISVDDFEQWSATI